MSQSALFLQSPVRDSDFCAESDAGMLLRGVINKNCCDTLSLMAHEEELEDWRAV